MTARNRIKRLVPRPLVTVPLAIVALVAAVPLAAGHAFGLFASTSSNGSNNFAASSCFQPIQISAANFLFSPASVTIASGCSVTWTQTSATKHTTTSDTGLWDSGQLGQNQTFTRQFNTAGTFAYHCSVHPNQMQATITVT